MDTVGDFVYNLQSYPLSKLDDLDMQSDEALDLLNQSLPRNIIVARIPIHPPLSGIAQPDEAKTKGGNNDHTTKSTRDI